MKPVNSVQTKNGILTSKEISLNTIPYRIDFAKRYTNNFDRSYLELIGTIGSGMSINQTSGNLVITSGTTANSETILRSLKAFQGNLDLKYITSLSQRIVNNNFFIELVDIIGDDLPYTINSSTSITVENTADNITFTSENIGQFLLLQNIQGTAGTISGRYAIASVNGRFITFTVSGFPSSGTGKLSLVGHNYIRALYSGTTATALSFEAQRNGYNATFAATINSTASAVINNIKITDQKIAFQDSLVAPAATQSFTNRADISQFLPDKQKLLFAQIRVLNGSTAPASNTTWTLNSYISIVEKEPEAMEVATTPEVTLNTNTNITNSTIAVVGSVAHSTASSGNPVRVGGRVVTTLDTTLVQGDASDLMQTSAGQVIQKPFGSAENDWQYAAAAGGIVNTTTAVTIRAAGAASIRNYITGITIMADPLSAATELVIRDGAAGTVIFRIKIPTTGLPTTNIKFQTPLKGTAATLLEVATLTATVTGAVYFNAQGYQSF